MTPLGIDRVLQDPRLLGAGLAPIDTWVTWIIVLKAAWCVIGRRGGKSRVAAALSIFFALFIKHRLASGERGMVLVLAMTVDQAKVVFDYTLGFITSPDSSTIN